MSILNTTNPTNFMLDIPDSGLTEATQMHVQVYKPPSLEIPGIDMPNGPFGKGRAMVPGTTFKYKPITLSILVDREMKVWLDMYRWALAIVDYQRYKNRPFEDVSDINMQLHILDNFKRNTVLIHEFTQPFPSLIYPPTFNHTAGTDYPMVMNVEFKYHTFNVLDSQGNHITPRETVDDARDSRYNQLKEDYIQAQKLLDKSNIDKPKF